MSSLIQNYTSGTAIPTPAAGTSTIYTNTSGNVVIKHPNSDVIHIEQQRLQTLPDVVGTFVSGQVPIYDGSVWVPGAPSSAVRLAPTIVSSGIVNVQVVLASGVIPNGGASTVITWSGISQDYDYLEVRGNARGAAATGGNANLMSCLFNGDLVSGNYISRWLQCSQFAFASNGNDFAYIGVSHSQLTSNTNCGDVNPIHFIVPNYSVAGQRKFAYTPGAIFYNPAGTQAANDHFCIQWENSTGPAINMITIQVDHATPTFTSGTNLQLIGHKRQWVIQSGIVGTLGISHGLLVP